MLSRHLTFFASFALTTWWSLRLLDRGVSVLIIVMALAAATGAMRFALRHRPSPALLLGLALGILRASSAAEPRPSVPAVEGPAWIEGVVVTATHAVDERGEESETLRLRDVAARPLSSPGPTIPLGNLLVFRPAHDRAPPPGSRLRGAVWIDADVDGTWARCGPGNLTEVADWRNRLAHGLERARERSRYSFARHASNPSASLLGALVLGDRLADPELRERIRRAGAAHFFSVSGLHLGLVVLLLAPLLKGRSRWRWLGLGLVGSYAVLTGARPPVLRAFGVFGFVILARATHRPLVGWQL
ncbi:MAG: ComEC/Rec2 family competence protein, partial [Planctomycetes bacterium]|nr:ComEC/Rec2 family competence protein [Planctomycetota bacterium]